MDAIDNPNDRIELSVGKIEEPPRLPCLICGASPMMGFVYRPNDPELPNVGYGLCSDHVEFGQEEIERRIQRLLREKEGR